MKKAQLITFVSLGPGDPELITLKGLRALQQADIILAPSTMSKENLIISRSKDILEALAIDEKKIRLFHVPMSKERLNTLENYEAVAKQASEYFAQNLNVVIVAEGDSGFYSSCQYINEALSEMGVSTQKIAGVPAFIACGALANIHVVKQNEQVIVIPGTITQNDLRLYLDSNKSLVIMKPSLSESIIKEFIYSENNIDHHYFENVGISKQEYYTTNKKTIIGKKFPYFSLLIIQNNTSL